jgi:hypothetical protein
MRNESRLHKRSTAALNVCDDRALGVRSEVCRVALDRVRLDLVPEASVLLGKDVRIRVHHRERMRSQTCKVCRVSDRRSRAGSKWADQKRAPSRLLFISACFIVIPGLEAAGADIEALAGTRDEASCISKAEGTGRRERKTKAETGVPLARTGAGNTRPSTPVRFVAHTHQKSRTERSARLPAHTHEKVGTQVVLTTQRAYICTCEEEAKLGPRQDRGPGIISPMSECSGSGHLAVAK